MRLVLGQAGPWEIIEAATGEEVLDLARNQAFDLIILDLAMPGLDGISVARVLGQRAPAIPILMHTLYWSRRVAVEALKVGVRKVIPKSDKATILNAVMEILDSESARESKPAELSLGLELLPEGSPTTPSPALASPDATAAPSESPSDSAVSDGSAPKA